MHLQVECTSCKHNEIFVNNRLNRLTTCQILFFTISVFIHFSLVKNVTVSMDPVHDRGSMDPVHESGP